MPTVHATTSLAATWVDHLLGLTRLSTGQENAGLGWRHELPVWLWVLIAVAAFVAAGWSYNRLIGPRGGRIALAILRGLVILFLAALLAGPMIVVEEDSLEQDWLLVLVDRSASMQTRDVITMGEGDEAIDVRTRDQALREALAEHLGVFDEDELGKDRRIVWLGFDRATREIDKPTRVETGASAKDESNGGAGNYSANNGDPSDAANAARKPTVALPDADGDATALRTAIEQALQRAVGRPISGIVLATDGRSPQATGADLVGRLKQQRVGVFAVPLGSDQTPLNLTLGRVDAPQRAFINDPVAVTVQIDATPADAAIDPSRVTVSLIDAQTKEVLSRRRLNQSIDEPVRLSSKSKLPGAQTWEVRVDYEPPADAPLSQRELIVDDNSDEIPIEMVDRPIRVLFVEGYPRWEYRYLKTLLMREKTIDSSMMLLSADSAFAQEGNSPITRLPRSAKEFEPYDVIIIGDVPADYFSAEQISLLRDHVSTEGAGVIWLGGQFFNPRSYDNTPLADLMPMRRPGDVTRIDPALGPIAMRPTPAADALNVLRLRADPTVDEDGGAEARNAAGAAWPTSLPPFLWAQDIGKLKPTAETLAVSNSLDGETLPLIARLRYGAGQALFLATDETWRWRYGVGELYFQQYWIQLTRMLARQRIQQRDDRVYLEVSNRRVQLDQTVTLTLHVRDALLIERNLPRITVGVTRADDPTGRVLERIDLARSPSAPGSSDAAPGDATPRVTYTAQWRTSVTGDLLLRVIEAGLDDLEINETIRVTHPGDERRQPATDHARLAALASETDGAVVPLAELDRLAELIPRRAQAVEDDVTEPLWDSPLALILFVLLITAEWIGRKAIRLV